MSASDPAALLERGIAQQIAGQHKAAIQIFRIVVKRGGGDGPVHFRLGLSLEAIGDLWHADEAYRAALERDPDLLPAYRRAADMALRARTQAARVGQSKAADDLGRAACRYLAGLGNRLQQQGEWEQAVAAFLEARTLAPDDWTVHVWLGHCLAQLGRFRAAEESMRTALGLAPGEAAAHYQLGAMLYQAGRVEEAEASWRDALTLDPAHAQAQTMLDEVQRARG